MRVVLDPNVLISAAISSGPPRQIVAAWTDGKFDLVVSPVLVGELHDVLNRPKLRRWVSTTVVDELIAGIGEDAVSIDDDPSPPRISPDPGDDYLVALARSAGAACIVSGDRHLLGLGEPDPPIFSPREFLDRLAA